MARPATSEPVRRSLRARLLPPLIAAVEHLPLPMVSAMRPATALALSLVPGWRDRVRRGMGAALGPENVPRGAVDRYFRRLADLTAYGTAVIRSGARRGGFAGEWAIRPDARDRVRAALARGKGALLVSPHFVGHEVMAGVLGQDFPITFLVRESPDAEYEAIKQRWYASLGVQTVYRPGGKGRARGLGEMAAALGVLKQNRILGITPDLVRSAGSGTCVRLFGRETWLPAGAFYLAVRTDAVFLGATYHWEAGRYDLRLDPPLTLDPALDRDAAVACVAQLWADQFEARVREHPEMWQFWLDKRWSRHLGVEQ